MKKANLRVFKATIVLTISLIAGTTHTTDLYIDNNYGAILKYILQSPSSTAPEHSIGVNLRSDSLGELRSVKNLYIRTTGKGSGYGLSPYYDLDYYLAKLRSEEEQHPNSNAIIKVEPSYLKWNITIYWEPTDVLSPDVISSPEEQKEWMEKRFRETFTTTPLQEKVNRTLPLKKAKKTSSGKK